jgi:hypothetical protein
MLRWVVTAGLLAVLPLGGCATAPTAPKTFAGTSGPVKWEVVDIGQVVATDDRGYRWSHTVVLTNTGTSAIQFERVQRGSRAASLEISSTGSTPFVRTLAPGAELRANFADIWQYTLGASGPFGGPASLDTLTVERRFEGKNERGEPVSVPVIVHLDRGVGKVWVRPHAAPPPPSKQVQAVTDVAGTWRGYYRQRENVFNVPLRLEVSTNGSFEAFENDPTTNRFQGWLNVRDGRVTLLQNRDSGTLTLHQDGGRRLLTGSLGGPRDWGRFEADLWLEAGPATAAVSPAPSGTAPASGTTTRGTGLLPSVQTAFDTYRSDPKFTPFKAFARDPASNAWGRSWGRADAASATELALYECRKRGTACEVYAVGDTVLDSVSSERRAAILLGGAHLTYKGVLTTVHEGREETVPMTFYLRRGVENITGAWSSEEPVPLISGVITDGVSDTNRATVKMTQSQPCRSELTGTVSISDDGKTLDAAYTGPRCDGAPVKATFRGTRQ